jgi:hypothetical protein
MVFGSLQVVMKVNLLVVGGVFWFGCGGLSCIFFIPRATYHY